jgi:hypothetical protein
MSPLQSKTPRTDAQSHRRQSFLPRMRRQSPQASAQEVEFYFCVLLFNRSARL